MKKRLASSRDVKAAAEIGNRAMEYYIKHGEFPTSREQPEPKMVEKWYVYSGKNKLPIGARMAIRDKTIVAYTLGEMVPSKRGVK